VTPVLDHARVMSMRLHRAPVVAFTADECSGLCYIQSFLGASLAVRDLERLDKHDVGQLMGSPTAHHGKETDVERAVEDEDDELGGARRVQAPRRVDDKGARDAERVHLKDLLGVGSRDELIVSLQAHKSTAATFAEVSAS